PGRPKQGVVPREVTLLPRHWDWLAAQPGGASVTLRRLVGGLLLADMAGVALLLVANPALRGETAVTIHMARFFSLVFIAVALQMWQPFGGALTAAGETDDQRRSQGMARRAPLTTLVLLVGCLSLAGLPLTLGFGGRWLVINLLLASDSTILALLLLATMGAGVLALLRAMPYWLAWHP
ncbi:MAG TPA: DUF2239 family protein, partial [Chloroflexota bacterium]|nr:DUF2239 family protein [Chloroflexota bacterium]